MRRHRIRNRILPAVAFMLAFIAAELYAKYTLVVQDFRETQWGDDVHPQVNELRTIGDHMTDYGALIYNDFYGKFYTIVDGERFVTDAPARSDRILWIFGNSTVFDYYTANPDTMASQIQRLLNQSGYRWRVRNEGMVGLPVSSEVVRLHNTPIQRGDIVVFLDGWVDSRFNEKGCDSQALSLLDLLCRRIGEEFHLQIDPDAYWRSVSSAKIYTQHSGATFYHFVQPIHDAYLLATPFVTLPDYAYVDEGHLNARGNGLIARALFEALTSI